MPHNRPLTLKVANRKDFPVLTGLLFVLAVVAAFLSPQPVFLTLFVVILFGAGRFIHTLDFSKVNDVKSKLKILPDGRVSLESVQGLKTDGLLNGQQWCTNHVAVLSYTSKGKQGYLLALSAQQDADEFRRLKVWLRQELCTDSGEKPVSGN